MAKLNDWFKADAILPSAAVFPSIDQKRLEKELNLRKVGAERGAADQPASEATELDHIEMDVVAKVEELRRVGLENFENNRRVYAGRLNEAGMARIQVQTEAENAKATFQHNVANWLANMVHPRDEVRDALDWRDGFRAKHKLNRPARAAAAWPKVIGLAALMILLESVGNSYLFSQQNTLGLLGGAIAAFLVSLGNVAASVFFGNAARYANHRNFLVKVVGALFFLAWVVFMLGYNLGVAHFRDAIEAGQDWQAAGFDAVTRLLRDHYALQAMESYVLLILGSLISIFAFLEGYNSRDPYPGYSRVAQTLKDAREDYIFQIEDALGELAENRDVAIEGLRLANDEVNRGIRDSIDALYGQQALAAQLTPFLDQCNIATNYLLAVYRDANGSARKTPAPPSFQKAYSFPTFKPSAPDDGLKKDAQAQLDAVTALVEKAAAEIFQEHHDATENLAKIEGLEAGGWRGQPAQTGKAADDTPTGAGMREDEEL